MAGEREGRERKQKGSGSTYVPPYLRKGKEKRKELKKKGSGDRFKEPRRKEVFQQRRPRDIGKKCYVFPYISETKVLLAIKSREIYFVRKDGRKQFSNEKKSEKYIKDGTPYCAGMPSALGGNRDDREGPFSAMIREALEESHGKINILSFDQKLENAPKYALPGEFPEYHFFTASGGYFKFNEKYICSESKSSKREYCETTGEILELDLEVLAGWNHNADIATECIFRQMEKQKIDVSKISTSSRREFKQSETLKALRLLAEEITPREKLKPIEWKVWKPGLKKTVEDEEEQEELILLEEEKPVVEEGEEVKKEGSWWCNIF